MNPATQPPAVHAGAIDQIEADRIGYEHGYRGMENPSPYDDSIPAATFRARCVGWLRGHDDRRFGNPHQFVTEPAVIEEEYRPTHQDRVTISAVAMAEWEGHSIGSDGIAGNPPSHYPADQREAWVRGYEAGFREFEADEFDRWVTEHKRQDEASSNPQTDWPEAELIRGRCATGHPSSDE